MAEEIITKRCPQCNEIKPISEFYRRKSRKTGGYCYCKKCQRVKVLAFHKTPKGRAGLRRRIAKWRATEKGRTYYEKYRKRPEVKARQKIHTRNKTLRLRGMSLADYEELLRCQNGVCAICGRNKRHKSGNTLNVDHDHRTGAVRGLLCYRCNTGIGLLGDSAKQLKAAAAYLESHAVIQISNKRKTRAFQGDAGQIPLFDVGKI